jgi:hypothetical protein
MRINRPGTFHHTIFTAAGFILGGIRKLSRNTGSNLGLGGFTMEPPVQFANKWRWFLQPRLWVAVLEVRQATNVAKVLAADRKEGFADLISAVTAGVLFHCLFLVDCLN